MKRWINPTTLGFCLLLLIGGLMLCILWAACTDMAPPPEDDSGLGFATGAKVPVDDNVYEIEGQVVGNVESLVRQTQTARGTMTGIEGYVSGVYFGAQFGGKGFVRLKVLHSDPPTFLAPPERIVLLKTLDSKASALLPGDVVTFRCRAQYEAVGSVRANEIFDAQKLSTWELDLCRMKNPIISIEPLIGEGQ